MKEGEQPSQWEQVTEDEFLEMLDALKQVFCDNMNMANSGLDSINNQLGQMQEYEERGFRITFHVNNETQQIKIMKHKKKWGLL